MKFITVLQVIEIHDDIIRRFGGSCGLMSRELLESAVFRMRASFDGKDLYYGIFEKATALFESLCKNHSFIDGNKRTAVVSAATFLHINGYDVEFDFKKAEKFVIDVAEGRIKFQDIVKFFKKCVV